MKYAYFILHALCLISPPVSALNTKNLTFQEIIDLKDEVPKVIYNLIYEYLNIESQSLPHYWKFVHREIPLLKRKKLPIEQSLLLSYFLALYDCSQRMNLPENSIGLHIFQSSPSFMRNFMQKCTDTLPNIRCTSPAQTCCNHIIATTTGTNSPFYTETFPRPLGINSEGNILLLSRGRISPFIISVRTDCTEILLKTLKNNSNLIGALWCYSHDQRANPINYIAIIYFDSVISTHDTSYNIGCSLFNASNQCIRSSRLQNLTDPTVAQNMGHLTRALNAGRIQSAHYDPQKDILTLHSLGFIENLPLTFQAQFLEKNGLNIAFPFLLPVDRKESKEPLIPRSIIPSAIISKHHFSDGYIWLTQSGTLIASYDTAQDNLPQKAIPLIDQWPVFWSCTPQFLLTATHHPRMSTITWCRKRLQYLPPPPQPINNQRNGRKQTTSRNKSRCITL